MKKQIHFIVRQQIGLFWRQRVISLQILVSGPGIDDNIDQDQQNADPGRSAARFLVTDRYDKHVVPPFRRQCSVILASGGGLSELRGSRTTEAAPKRVDAAS